MLSTATAQPYREMLREYRVVLTFPNQELEPEESKAILICKDNQLFLGEWIYNNFKHCQKCRRKCKAKSKVNVEITFPRSKYFFSFYSCKERMYIYIGKYLSLLKKNTILADEIEGDVITIKCRRYYYQNCKREMELCNKDDIHARDANGKKRKIGDVVIIVKKWIDLSKATTEGSTKKIGRRKAASMLNYAKKTLDYYLPRVRTSRQHGFNFSIHYKESISILLDFYDKLKSKEPSNPHKEYFKIQSVS